MDHLELEVGTSQLGFTRVFKEPDANRGGSGPTVDCATMSLTLASLLDLPQQEKCRNYLERKRRREVVEDYRQATEAVRLAEDRLQERVARETRSAQAAFVTRERILLSRRDDLQSKKARIQEQQSALTHFASAFALRQEATAVCALFDRDTQADLNATDLQLQQTQRSLEEINTGLQDELQVIAQRGFQAAQELFGPVPDLLGSSPNINIQEVT